MVNLLAYFSIIMAVSYTHLDVYKRQDYYYRLYRNDYNIYTFIPPGANQ